MTTGQSGPLKVHIRDAGAGPRGDPRPSRLGALRQAAPSRLPPVAPPAGPPPLRYPTGGCRAAPFVFSEAKCDPAVGVASEAQGTPRGSRESPGSGRQSQFGRSRAQAGRRWPLMSRGGGPGEPGACASGSSRKPQLRRHPGRRAGGPLGQEGETRDLLSFAGSSQALPAGCWARSAAGRRGRGLTPPAQPWSRRAGGRCGAAGGGAGCRGGPRASWPAG